MNTMQEIYSGVGCEVLCNVFQIGGDGVAWKCRAPSSFIGFNKVFSLEGMAQNKECDEDRYCLQSCHC